MWVISWDLLKFVDPSAKEGAKNWDEYVVRKQVMFVNGLGGLFLFIGGLFGFFMYTK